MASTKNNNKIIIAFKQLELLEDDLKKARKAFFDKKKEFYRLMRFEARK